MYSAAFIFEPGQIDSDFHALNEVIQEVAESTAGYLGMEFWKSADGKKLNSTYYWDNEEALKHFASHPKHAEAKQQYSKWYNGYHVVISKIERSYGDNTIEHITSSDRVDDA